jgi:hypothetical protein
LSVKKLASLVTGPLGLLESRHGGAVRSCTETARFLLEAHAVGYHYLGSDCGWLYGGPNCHAVVHIPFLQSLSNQDPSHMSSLVTVPRDTVLTSLLLLLHVVILGLLVSSLKRRRTSRVKTMAWPQGHSSADRMSIDAILNIHDLEMADETTSGDDDSGKSDASLSPVPRHGTLRISRAGRKPRPPCKKYTKEQGYFIWYCRTDLEEPWDEVERNFEKQFEDKREKSGLQ